MSFPIQLALVPDHVGIGMSELTQVASALSKQANRDFRPLWSVDATVDAFAHLHDVPIDYWPIIVMPDVKGAAGYHQDEDGQPYAVVEFGDHWSITASHEMLEMLADPWGRRLRAGNMLDQAVNLGLGRQRVNYLVEVCDPSESGRFAYQVNGVWVSDFYTPHFFDPVRSSSVRYSYSGAIHGPRQVLDGGYISWQNPATREWWQLRMFPDEFSSKVPHLVNLTREAGVGRSGRVDNIRSQIDRLTRAPDPAEGLREQLAAYSEAEAEAATRSARTHEEGDGRDARADALRIQIGKMMEEPESQPAD